MLIDSGVEYEVNKMLEKAGGRGNWTVDLLAQSFDWSHVKS